MAIAVKPYLPDRTIVGQYFGELLSKHPVVFLLSRWVFGDAAAADACAPLLISRVDINAQVQAVLCCGGSQVFQYIALTVFPRHIPNPVFGCLSLPPAKSSGMFGDKDDHFGTPGFGYFAPLIGIELG